MKTAVCITAIPKVIRQRPASWLKARNVIRNAKQRHALERHVKTMRSEWR